MNQSQKDELEILIDRTSLSSVVSAMSEICFEKAEHIRVSCIDPDLPRIWDSTGRKLDGVIVGDAKRSIDYAQGLF